MGILKIIEYVRDISHSEILHMIPHSKDLFLCVLFLTIMYISCIKVFRVRAVYSRISMLFIAYVIVVIFILFPNLALSLKTYIAVMISTYRTKVLTYVYNDHGHHT